MADKAFIDSQGITIQYKIPSATDYAELFDVTDSPLPTKKRETDDVTTVKSRSKETVAAGVTSSDDLAFECLQISASKQQAELDQHFSNGQMLDFKMILDDVAQTTYSFQGTLTELTPVRAANKKNRLKLTIAVNGAVNVTTKP